MSTESVCGLPRELWWLIFKQMTPVDLTSFSKGDTTFLSLVICFRKEMFTVERALGKFLLYEEMGDYQDLQADTGLLVTGSGVLGFFNHDDMLSDFDTFCNVDQSVCVGTWYLSHGFTFEPSRDQLPCFANEFVRTRELRRNQDHFFAIPFDEDIRDTVYDNVVQIWTFKRGRAEVRLVATDGIPLQGILSVHSTCLMNILTHRAAYCCFPKLTLEEQTTMLIDLCTPFTESQMKTVKDLELRGLSVLYSPSGSVYRGKRSPVNDYVEANTWSLAYTRKLNTCDYFPIGLPTTWAEYITSPEFAPLVGAQLVVLRGQIESGLISSDSAVLLVQELARKKRRKFTLESSYMQLSSIVSVAASAGFNISAAVAQDLFKYIELLNNRFPNLSMSHPVIKTRSHRDTVMRVTFTLQSPAKRVDWNTLKQMASRFAFDNIVLHLHRKFR
ncbi:hypothetical protein EV368DRAFT_84830 [Lentinula lateritia]|nr:hypothetical protein EV368DRAFT_84830 [Lentinula lateritia]